MWPQSSLRQMSGLGVKALEPHPGGEHCQKSLGLGCPGRADSAAASALALTARPHRRRPVIPDAPGGESDPGFCLDGESTGLAVTRHTVPVRPFPSRDPAGSGRQGARSLPREDSESGLANECWHHGPRSARSPGSLNPTSAKVGTSGARLAVGWSPPPPLQPPTPQGISPPGGSGDARDSVWSIAFFLASSLAPKRKELK